MGRPWRPRARAESLFAQPRGVGDPVRVAARLAPLIGVPERELHAALTGGKPFVWLRRRLPPSVAADVRALREPGLGFLPEPLRLYPNRELAAHVVGFEGVGRRARGHRARAERHAGRHPGQGGGGPRRAGARGRHRGDPPEAGAGPRRHADASTAPSSTWPSGRSTPPTGGPHAKAAMAVVLEPRTGDVLAIAVRPTFNPNTFLDVPSRDALAQPRRDRSVRAGLDLQGHHGRRRARGGRGAARGSDLGRERQHHHRQDHDPRLEEVRLAVLRRGACRTPRTWAPSRWGWRSGASATTVT